jgi:hypothetical protein
MTGMSLAASAGATRPSPKAVIVLGDDRGRLVCICIDKKGCPQAEVGGPLDQLAGLPNDEDLEREIAAASGEPEPAPESKPALPSRFTRKSSARK